MAGSAEKKAQIIFINTIIFRIHDHTATTNPPNADI